MRRPPQLGDIVLLATPWDESGLKHRRAVAAPLAGRLVVSCINPLGFDARGPYGLPVARGQRRGTGRKPAAGQHGHGRVPPPLGARAWSTWTTTCRARTCWSAATTTAARARVVELAMEVTGRPGVDVGATAAGPHARAFHRGPDRGQPPLQDTGGRATDPRGLLAVSVAGRRGLTAQGDRSHAP